MAPEKKGALLARLVNAAGPGMDPAVEAQPLWLSRQVVARAAILEGTREELAELFARRRLPTLREFASTVGLSPEDFGELGRDPDRWLDDAGFDQVVIVAYAAKYASAFYGPFREAAESTMAFGDRSSYQMDPANRREALREIELDVAEGADVVMVKPALPYLDVVADARAAFDLPVAAYHVSGEYAMVRAAAERGWLGGDRAMREAVQSIRRAGADVVLTYAAIDLARHA